MDAWTYYVNFVVLAITGHTGPADTLFSKFKSQIEDCAKTLQQTSQPTKDIFRGLLLPFATTSLANQPQRTFLSFSLDPRVAHWFAHPQSIMSVPLVHSMPTPRSFVAHIPSPDPSTILFRPDWTIAIEQKINSPLSFCAVLHPWVDAEQFNWNLHTQQEVITSPIDPLPISPLDLSHIDVRKLDREFCFPEFLCKDSSSSTNDQSQGQNQHRLA